MFWKKIIIIYLALPHTFLPSIQGAEARRNRQRANHQKTWREAFLLHLTYP